jgi:hypothetical protein
VDVDFLGIGAGLVLIAIFVWIMTAGRRYLRSEPRRWPQVRRDLYSGTLDDGMYPLDPPRDDATRPVAGRDRS